MSATPDSAIPSPGPAGVPSPPSGRDIPADRLHLHDASAQRPRLARPGPGPVWLAPPQLPPWPIVWLALEGHPAGGQADRAVHLWGLAVDDGGDEPRPEAITADFEEPGGRRAWEHFVARASEILEQRPDARWVHSSPRERTWVRDYAATCGAPKGFLERMEEALFDLLDRGVRRCVRLPLGSCSIRQVAAYAGFRGRNPEAGPAGSFVRYQKARASRVPAEREHILRGIADSNVDDLSAMRAVWRWMLEQGPREYCG
jgi:predicted RecB family nuclease